MDTKIVFFDIDGTIYSYEKGIPKDTAKAIELLKANGHIPVICTGRTKCMIYPDFINLGFDNIIAGAGTYCETKNFTIRSLRMLKQEELLTVSLNMDFFHWQKEKNIFMLELILLILFMQTYSIWTYIIRKFLIQLKQ